MEWDDFYAACAVMAVVIAPGWTIIAQQFYRAVSQHAARVVALAISRVNSL